MRPTLAAALLSLTWLAPAQAQVTFDEALALGDEAPMAQGARRALAIREAADDSIGGTAQGTTLTLMPGAVLAPAQERGFELQLNATQGWNLGDLGGARRRAAGHERLALAARARAEALESRLEAARAWVALRTLETLEEALDRRAEVTARWLHSTERAVEAGVALAADLADARASVAELAQQRLALEGERVDGATQLASAMGRPPAATLRTAGPPPDPQLPEGPTLRRLASVEELPMVAAQRLAELAARAREAETSAQYAPVLQVGAQLERASNDAWTLYGIVGVSFNGRHTSDRATSLARAEAEELGTRAEVARIRASADLSRALHEVEHTRRRVQTLERELLPALATLRRRRERALELGEGTVFAALDARRRELAAEEALVRARGEQLWAELRMWLLLVELQRGTEDDR